MHQALNKRVKSGHHVTSRHLPTLRSFGVDVPVLTACSSLMRLHVLCGTHLGRSVPQEWLRSQRMMGLGCGSLGVMSGTHRAGRF